MKKKILLTMLVCTLLNACSTYSPLVVTMGRSGTFDESRAEHLSNDKVICEKIATNNTTFFGNIGFFTIAFTTCFGTNLLCLKKINLIKESKCLKKYFLL